jgi:N-acetylmuramoyl-L-alanine amidase
MRVADVPFLARFAIACLALIALAYAIGQLTGDDGAATVTTPTIPEPLSPFDDVSEAGTGVVRTASGLILPITGGTEGAWQVLTPCANELVVDGERVAGAHVVIDPGHGGFETGAVGPSGIVEAEVNLDVARRTRDRLEALGATVVLTRDDDIRLTLQTRVEIAQALDPLLFISIHHNGGPTRPSSRPGTQVYHQHQTPQSARFAGVVFEHLQEAFAPFSDTWSGGNATGVRPRLTDDGTDFYGVLRGTAGVPSVLIEALYQSSEPEASLLLRDDVRDAEAQAIADAVVAWIESPYAGSGYLPPLVASESAGGGGGTAGCEDPEELTAPTG